MNGFSTQQSDQIKVQMMSAMEGEMNSGLEKVSLLEQTPSGSIGGAVGGLGLTPLSNSNFGSNSHFGTARTA